MGLPVVNRASTRKEGIDLMYMYLSNDWLTFSNVLNVSTVYNREMTSYRWTDRVDPHSKDRYSTRTPVDHHGDALDALRHAILLAYRYCWTDSEGQTRMGSIKWS